MLRNNFKYENFHLIIVSEREIAYDLRLEEQLEEIKLRIWMNEELQIQPKHYHTSLKQNFLKFLKEF